MAFLTSSSCKCGKWTSTIFCIVSLSEAGQTVRVGIYQNPPGVFTNADGAVQGFYIDVLETIANEETWDIEYLPGSWPEGLARLQTKQIDLLVAIAYTQEREKTYDFNHETVFSNWGQGYFKTLDIQGVRDLTGRKVAGLKDDIYTNGFTSLLDRFSIPHELVEVSEYAQVLERVAKGQVDAGIISRSNGLATEKEYDVIRGPIICCPMEIRYAAPKGKKRKLLDALDRHLAR